MSCLKCFGLGVSRISATSVSAAGDWTCGNIGADAVATDDCALSKAAVLMYTIGMWSSLLQFLVYTYSAG